MAIKETLKSVKGYSDIELLMTFEMCVAQLVKEANSIRGETKATVKSYELLKNEMRTRMNIKEDYDDGYNIIGN